MSGYKVRLADGSEIGSMDLQAVRNWYAQGLLDTTSPVLKPGAKNWTPLAEAIDLVDLRAPRRGGGRRARDARHGGPVSYVWPMRVAAVLALAAAAGAAFLWWSPRRFTPAIDPVPWREMGLGLFATSLLLARGWGFGRRLAQLVLLLATAALPVPGRHPGRGGRARPSAAGPAGRDRLHGRPVRADHGLRRAAGTSPRPRLWWPRPVWWGSGTTASSRRAPCSARSRQWAGPETSLSNDGLSLALPASWRVLKAGQTAVAAPPGTKAVLGDSAWAGSRT